MELTVHEVARLTGVSARTLHYYDEIGLLKPMNVLKNGYRIYGEDELSQLQQIMFFKELGFSLKETAEIIKNPSFDRKSALKNHRKTLTLRRTRLDGLIALIDSILKGDDTMSFKEFDMTEIEKANALYANEAKKRWGKTDAYAESTAKTNSYGKEDWSRVSAEADDIYRRFALCMNEKPADSAEAKQLAAEWQGYITKNFYTCTDEILAGLGEMYVADERFTENIDKFGKGLAQYISDAIKAYCAAK